MQSIESRQSEKGFELFVRVYKRETWKLKKITKQKNTKKKGKTNRYGYCYQRKPSIVYHDLSTKY